MTNRLILVFVVTFICSLPLFAQGVISVDRRSLKGKIEISDTEPLIVSVSKNGQLRLGKLSTTLGGLKSILDSVIDRRTPDMRKIYIEAGSEVPFDRVVQIMVLGRALDVDDFGLILDNGVDDGRVTNSIDAKIVLESFTGRQVKPNPLFLRISYLSGGGLTLTEVIAGKLVNQKIGSDELLKRNLSERFEQRKQNEIFMEGTKDVERTVFLKPNLSTGSCKFSGPQDFSGAQEPIR